MQFHGIGGDGPGQVAAGKGGGHGLASGGIDDTGVTIGIDSDREAGSGLAAIDDADIGRSSSVVTADFDIAVGG